MNEDFKRPGIDDKPDPDKVLTAEDKASIARLAVLPESAEPEASRTEAAVQSTKLAAEAAAPMAAAASIATVDAAVPDPNSAFLDMRDPMVAADGTRPNKLAITRLTIAFTLSAVLCAIPWMALNSVVVPEILDRLDPAGRETMFAAINAVGAVVALVSNVLFGALSDTTRTPFGRRTPWIVGGGVLTALFTLLLGATHAFPAMLFAWCGMQFGYNMMLAPFVAAMADRLPDKVRGRVSRWYGTGIAVGQMLGLIVGAGVLARVGATPLNAPAGPGANAVANPLDPADLAVLGSVFVPSAILFALIGLVVVLIWPREPSSVEQANTRFDMHALLADFRPPHHAPDYYRMLVARTLMMAGYGMIPMYELYILKYYSLARVIAGPGAFVTSAPALLPVAVVIAVMAVIAFVASLIAAFVAGPLVDKFGVSRNLVMVCCLLCLIGVILPWILPSGLGMWLFAAIAGFGYGLYNAVDHALSMTVLPDPSDAGRDLAVLNLTNTLSVVVAAVVGAVAVVFGGYSWLFISALIMIAVAVVLFSSLKSAH
ncbi:MFS transporter [Bifidobacterium callimiconis]|uniref:Major Facilitator Superfamily n=1 Tax=Bifidobacterium callimiconis TaxID=2306973 RepID=A0A430FB08_9BIFI|nr:MFS transporter [Bifidobacterium callimiconis]MBT1176974.1 MFS transporter [Bifidobacterium callimiconis]RSX50001.1 Major Facilitator Superfamily [Bifidobacterium callimiconis]